jgi:hypothetical protein
MQQAVYGLTPQKKTKNNISDDTSGLDISPSTIALISVRDALLEQFCDEVVPPWKEIRREQRAQDRSLRAMNPINYNDKGTVKGLQMVAQVEPLQEAAEENC